MAFEDFRTAEVATHYLSGASPDTAGERFRRLCGRIRYQLLGGFIACIVLPIVLRFMLVGNFGGETNLRNSVLGSLWALVVGFLAFRKMTAFPGVRATGYILPIFFTAFGAMMLFFLALRIDYSRFQMFTSFALTSVFFYSAYFYARAATKPAMQLITVGRTAQLSSIRSIAWRFISAPEDIRHDQPIVVDLRARLGGEWERLIAERALAGQPVYDAKQVFESLSGRVQIEHLSENTFGSLIPDSIYAAAKRQLDFVIALAAIMVLFIPLAIIALLIRLDSSGPAIFRQQRMGYRAKPFKVYKFRTMRADAELAGPDAAMTVENDPRITRLGQLLRRTRIDELPQLINILKGEMSWIGPRPEAVELSERYEAQLPFYVYRHAVRPGISGWAQVNQGHVTSVEDVDRKLQYDFFYVKHFSLWLDLLVLLKTIKVMLTGHGAR